MGKAQVSLLGVTNIPLDISVQLSALLYITGAGLWCRPLSNRNTIDHRVRHHWAVLLHLLRPCLADLNVNLASTDGFPCLGSPGTSVTLIGNASLTSPRGSNPLLGFHL